MSVFGDMRGRSDYKTPESQAKKSRSVERAVLKQIEGVQEKAKEMEQKIEALDGRLGTMGKHTDSRLQEIKKDCKDQMEKLGELSRPVEEELRSLKEETISLKTETISLKEETAALKEEVISLREAVRPQEAEADGEESAAAQTLDEKLENMRIDINDRVHSESVKCYRNIKGLLEDVQEQFEEQKKSEEERRKKNPFRGMRFFAAFAFIDFIVLALYILYTMGLLDSIIGMFL